MMFDGKNYAIKKPDHIARLGKDDHLFPRTVKIRLKGNPKLPRSERLLPQLLTHSLGVEKKE